MSNQGRRLAGPASSKHHEKQIQIRGANAKEGLRDNGSIYQVFIKLYLSELKR